MKVIGVEGWAVGQLPAASFQQPALTVTGLVAGDWRLVAIRPWSRS